MARKETKSSVTPLRKTQDFMKQLGSAEKELFEKIAPQLSATKVVFSKVGGKVVDVFIVPDHGSRLKAANTILDFLESYPAKPSTAKTDSSKETHIFIPDMHRPFRKWPDGGVEDPGAGTGSGGATPKGGKEAVSESASQSKVPSSPRPDRSERSATPGSPPAPPRSGS